MTISLRPVSIEDEAFLFEVYAGTRAEELAALGWSDAQRELFLRMQFDAQRRDYERRFTHGAHSIIVSNGRPAGRIWVERTDEYILVVDIALLPAYRNAGIGSFLFRELMKEADDARKTLRLTVSKSNAGAMRFYGRLGFNVTGETDLDCRMERPAAK